MLNEADGQFLKRAIRVAMNGRGGAEPNPMVGCVIVRAGQTLGEGWHQRYGQPHAEPNALTAVETSGHSASGATAYVTLEPCCHLDKQTPPCAPRLIKAKIARVVIGCLDPNPKVNGAGVKMLQDAGITVDLADPGIEAEAKQLIAPFIAHTVYQRPYVTLKWAQSANGKVAGRLGRRVKITNEASNAVIHGLRGRCDAIAVGTNTVLNDDPMLTVRQATQTPFSSPRVPIRVVLSNTLKLDAASNLVKTAREVPVVLYCSEVAAAENFATVSMLRDAGVDVVALPNHESRFSFRDVLSDLYARRVTHLLIEPGPTLTKHFFARGQADRVWVFTSPKALANDSLAISTAPRVEGYIESSVVNLDGDFLHEYFNPDSDAFFSPVPSADIELLRSQISG